MSSLASVRLVTLEAVRAARERITPHVHVTPVLRSRTLDTRASAEVHLKAEIFQRAGAFKARGAFSRLTLLSEGERACGVVAFSSGNHAQAVALAARELGMRATIVMPRDAPAAKIAGTRGYGAEVVLYERGVESREAIASRLVGETGAILVPPFDDDAVIAGQGTLALELLEAVPDLDAVVAPCGGGGLLSGISVVFAALRKDAAVWGVEPEAGDDMQRSLAVGEPVEIAQPRTIADSLQTTRPALRTLAHIAAQTRGVVLVSDDELRAAVAFAFERLKVVVEPGGAAALAALLAGRFPELAGRKAGVVLSGGNLNLPAGLTS